jgi:hypothetical protein
LQGVIKPKRAPPQGVSSQKATLPQEKNIVPGKDVMEILKQSAKVEIIEFGDLLSKYTDDNDIDADGNDNEDDDIKNNENDDDNDDGKNVYTEMIEEINSKDNHDTDKDSSSIKSLGKKPKNSNHRRITMDFNKNIKKEIFNDFNGHNNDNESVLKKEDNYNAEESCDNDSVVRKSLKKKNHRRITMDFNKNFKKEIFDDFSENDDNPTPSHTPNPNPNSNPKSNSSPNFNSSPNHKKNDDNNHDDNDSVLTGTYYDSNNDDSISKESPKKKNHRRGTMDLNKNKDFKKESEEFCNNAITSSTEITPRITPNPVSTTKKAIPQEKNSSSELGNFTPGEDVMDILKQSAKLEIVEFGDLLSKYNDDDDGTISVGPSPSPSPSHSPSRNLNANPNPNPNPKVISKTFNLLSSPYPSPNPGRGPGPRSLSGLKIIGKICGSDPSTNYEYQDKNGIEKKSHISAYCLNPDSNSVPNPDSNPKSISSLIKATDVSKSATGVSVIINPKPNPKKSIDVPSIIDPNGDYGDYEDDFDIESET